MDTILFVCLFVFEVEYSFLQGEIHIQNRLDEERQKKVTRNLDCGAKAVIF